MFALSHIGICVSDLGRSLAFYEKALGFTKSKSFELGEEIRGLLGVDGYLLCHCQFVKKGNLFLELIQYVVPGYSGEGGSAQFNRLGMSHLSFRVDDIARATAMVAEFGGEVFTGTKTV